MLLYLIVFISDATYSTQDNQSKVSTDDVLKAVKSEVFF